MTWDIHINKMVNKANRTLGFLRCNLKISSSSIKEKSYKAFVRPLLEYASSVWGPYTQKSIDKLEAVQRCAACFVLNRYHNTSSVSRMIDQLRWPSLEQRRKTTYLGIMYKIHHGLIHCPIVRSKLVPPPPRQRRTHNQQFYLINTRTQYRGSSFLPKTVRDWNNLPSETAEAATADAFV